MVIFTKPAQFLIKKYPLVKRITGKILLVLGISIVIAKRRKKTGSKPANKILRQKMYVRICFKIKDLKLIL